MKIIKLPDKRITKKIKHFAGWLFKYCPYGHTCIPKHPFRLDHLEFCAYAQWAESLKYIHHEQNAGGGAGITSPI